MTKEEGERADLHRFHNFHKTGSIIGMKRLYYGTDAFSFAISQSRIHS